jgi:predicted O-methyltransferase YrrM
MIIKLDSEILRKLKTVPIEECGLFDNYDTNIMHNQMQFLADILIESKPKRILEIGTNHGYFPYFAHCIYPEVIIDTVDINKNSQVAVDILKDAGVLLNFYHMPSSEFFKDAQFEFDFAWIDGSHKKEDCLNDLLSCMYLNIPIICVDDFRSNDGVFRAIFEFYKVSGYQIHSQSYIMDHRGIICFSKSKETL